MSEPSEPASLRCFLAVDLTADVRTALARAQARLRRIGARVGWVPEENLHLTLFFLGDVVTPRLPDVASLVSSIAPRHEPCTMSVRGLGFFGSPRHPKVIWAGVADPPPSLLALQADLSGGLEALGFEPDRRGWSPHITLGRVRGPQRVGELTSQIGTATTTDFGCVPVQRVVVLKSTLRTQGPRYELLHAVPLKGV